MAVKKKTSTAGKKSAGAKNKGNNKKSTVKPAVKKNVAKKEIKLTKAQQRERDEKKQFISKEVTAVGLIGLAVLIFVCVVAGENMGIVGGYGSAFLRHTFGVGAVVLPIVLLIYGIQMLKFGDDPELKRKAILFAGFFLTFISLAHTLKGWEPSDSFFQYISNSFLNGSLKNGGLIGAIFGGFLSKILGQLGAYIVLFAALVMLFIMATGKSIMQFLNGIGEFIDGVRENPDFYYEEYEQESENEVQEKDVEKEPEHTDKENENTEEDKENTVDKTTDEVKEFPVKEKTEEIHKKEIKRKGGFFSLFKKQEEVQEEEPYVPPVVTFEIEEDNRTHNPEDTLELDNCDVVNQRYNYLHRPREFDESIPRLKERVQQIQEAVSRGDEKQYVSQLLKGIESELNKYSSEKNEKTEEITEKTTENIINHNTEDNIPSLKEEIKEASEIYLWNKPSDNVFDENKSYEENKISEEYNHNTEESTAEDEVQPKENTSAISAEVLEITPIEDNNLNTDIEKIALDALKSINKPSIQIVSSEDFGSIQEENTEKTPEEVTAPFETEEKFSAPKTAFTQSIFRTENSPVNQNSLSGRNFSYSEPEIIEAEEEKTVSKLTNQSESVNIPYRYPKIDFLAENPNENGSFTSRDEKMRKVKKLEETLAIFGVEAKVNNISQGPAVTRFELTPPVGVRVNKIEGLADDIALALAAKSIRIEAPIPGMSAVGIEIPNDKISNVYFREILQTEKFNSYEGKLAFGMGKDIAGNIVVSDISKMPHLLIAGATGSGKSVCVNTIITSMLYKYSPDEVRLILVDPKVVELSVYNGIPHLLIPVVTDPHKASGALNWAVREMMRRYDLFASTGSRKLDAYNQNMPKEERLPQIVIIIDELADLMMVAKKEVEDSIVRLTQLARAAGIYLIVATQRPSVNVITGLIKANIPSRIAFKVSSPVDSRTILDCSGAEKLLGRGDMLFRSVSMDKPLRIQGAFVSDDEVERIVDYIKVDDSHYDQEIIKQLESSNSDELSVSGGSGDSEDELTKQAIGYLVHSKKASISGLQRKFKIGYNRAANIIEDLEERGIVGPDNGGTKGREVLMDEHEYREWMERNS